MNAFSVQAFTSPERLVPVLKLFAFKINTITSNHYCNRNGTNKIQVEKNTKKKQKKIVFTILVWLS